MMIGTGTATVTRCPKCNKPYYYVGDPVGDISRLICTCNNGNWVTNIAPPGINLSRIEELLERIAVSLEIMTIATPPPPPVCVICKRPSDFWTTAPFGSKHEDEKVCAECFDKLFLEAI